ncbi:MAG: aldo/keto reductase [Bacilli bacterium]|nr:aldo/keto reductase [Bacilli bacterium]
MKYRMLGKTQLNISEVGCGGIPIQHISQEEVNKLVEKLYEQGVNFIDSARGYTTSEEMFGKALKNLRDKFYIATKSMSRSYEDMKRDIDISLKNFQTDHIDLYQIHNLRDDNYKGCLKALLEAKEMGKVKHIGFSSHSVDFALKLISETDIFETIQIPYNFLELQAVELFKKAHEKNIGVIVMKPVAGGNIDNVTVSLKYILSNENVSVAIPGMENIQQVIENTSIENYNLSKDDLKYIEETRGYFKNEFCDRCGYCMPCSVGIDIPSSFTYENYYKKYNLKEWAIARYNGMKVKASACIECRKCEQRCPYDLHIVDKLKRVVEVFEHER